MNSDARQNTNSTSATYDPATGKGFAIGSAALTALALLASFIEEAKIWIGKFDSGLGEGINVAEASKMSLLSFVDQYQLTIMNPLLLGGLFLGGMVAASFHFLVSGTSSIISPISHCNAVHIFTRTSVVTFSFFPSFAIEA